MKFTHWVRVLSGATLFRCLCKWLFFLSPINHDRLYKTFVESLRNICKVGQIWNIKNNEGLKILLKKWNKLYIFLLQIMRTKPLENTYNGVPLSHVFHMCFIFFLENIFSNHLMSDFAVDMQLKPDLQRCPCNVQNVILLPCALSI